ncbi:MAG: hypothetical protein JO189_02265 [Deltaproteobacteria bacterium]|nr:hypothetical protein [Deltaproteobacteria bacterium]
MKTCSPGKAERPVLFQLRDPAGAHDNGGLAGSDLPAIGLERAGSTRRYSGTNTPTLSLAD